MRKPTSESAVRPRKKMMPAQNVAQSASAANEIGEEACRRELQNAGRGRNARREICLPIGREDRGEAVLGEPALRVLQRLAQSEGEQQAVPAILPGEVIGHIRAEQA